MREYFNSLIFYKLKNILKMEIKTVITGQLPLEKMEEHKNYVQNWLKDMYKKTYYLLINVF